MIKFAKHITLFLLPFIIAAIALFIIPVEKDFSYHFVQGECNDKASWIYHRIFENNKDIDVVFSGASQTGCAIMDEYIDVKFAQHSNEKLNVVNLGYCRRGRDVQFVMLQDLFRNKKPKILIVEVAEDEPKKSHPVFPYLAETSDLFGSAILFNQRFFISIWKGLVVRFEYLKYKIFDGKNIKYDHSNFSYLSSQQIAAPETITKNAQIWQRRLANPNPLFLRKLELNYSKHYVQKIAELAEQNNCKLLFLYLPESGSKLTKPLLFDFYKSMAPVLLLPDSITTNANNWKDQTHFNDFGAKEISDMIQNKLLDLDFKQ